MSSEWPLASLRDIAELLPGFAFKSDGYTNDKEHVRLLRGDNIAPGKVRWDGVKRWPEAFTPALERYKLELGDVVLAMDRPWIPAGLKVAQIQEEDTPSLLVQRVARLRAKSRDDAGFLFALLSGPDFKSYIQNATTGTAVPHISAKQILDYRFALPPESARTTLGTFTAALENRISLLRETNATLEAIAQALFKSWFVDFDPVRAKMEGRAPEGMDEATAALFPDSLEETELGGAPKGWKMAPLATAFEINPSRKLRKGELAAYLDMANIGTRGHVIETATMREVGSGSKFRNGDTLLARITPCLENGKTAFVDFLPENAIAWGSTEFVVLRPKPPLPPYFAYLLCRHEAFRKHAVQSMSGTSGRQRIQSDVLGCYPIAVPGTQVADTFGQIVSALQERIAANHANAKTLAALRDTLLPRLISGQLRLPEVAEALSSSEPEAHACA